MQIMSYIKTPQSFQLLNKVIESVPERKKRKFFQFLQFGNFNLLLSCLIKSPEENDKTIAILKKKMTITLKEMLH